MSALARSLLALACAALLHASSADVVQRVSAGTSNQNQNDFQMPLAHLEMGIVDSDDKNLRKIELQPYIVPPTKSDVDFIVNVPNEAHKDEILVGQDLAAFDDSLTASRITLTPVKKGHHSPLKVHCIPKCPNGVTVYADQYAIKTLG